MTCRSALLLAAVLPGAFFFNGCVAKSKSAMSGMMPSSDQMEMVRSSYKTAFPSASVGVVNAVLPDKPYAMVTQIDTSMLKEGQIVTFLDAAQKVIANGSIVKVDAASVSVMFDAGARRPMVGDIGVKF